MQVFISQIQDAKRYPKCSSAFMCIISFKLHRKTVLLPYLTGRETETEKESNRANVSQLVNGRPGI